MTKGDADRCCRYVCLAKTGIDLYKRECGKRADAHETDASFPRPSVDVSSALYRDCRNHEQQWRKGFFSR